MHFNIAISTFLHSSTQHRQWDRQPPLPTPRPTPFHTYIPTHPLNTPPRTPPPQHTPSGLGQAISKRASHDFIFRISLYPYLLIFCIFRGPSYGLTNIPKQSCRNDIFNAREPNICSLNYFFFLPGIN